MPVKMLSFATLVIPVINPRSRYSFVLNVELNRPLKNLTVSSQYPEIHASCIGVSYSSKIMITF